MEAMRGAKGVSVAIVAVVAIVLFVAGIGVGYLFFSPPSAKVSKLFLGTNTPFPPFESRNATSDALEGFDIDLIQTIVQRGWGYTECSDTVTNHCYEWNDFRDFSALLAAVSVGRMDIAVGAITENGAVGAERNNTRCSCSRSASLTSWSSTFPRPKGSPRRIPPPMPSGARS